MGSHERIADDLRNLGVRAGDSLMVHASLRAVGAFAPWRTAATIEGGADGLLDVLHEVIGPAGTLFMNIGADDDWAWVNERPPNDRAALLADAVPFDPLSTPAEADNGVLAEVFRCRSGTSVSDHPEGRFAASGPLADRLLLSVPWDDYYGLDSPLDRFVHAGGRVLRLGADRGTLTLIHFAENLVDLPWKCRVLRHRLLATSEGPVICTIRTIDDSNGIVEHPGDDYFITLLADFLATGRAEQGLVGRAKSELFNAADLVLYAVVWLREHLIEASTAAAKSASEGTTR